MTSLKQSTATARAALKQLQEVVRRVGLLARAHLYSDDELKTAARASEALRMAVQDAEEIVGIDDIMAELILTIEEQQDREKQALEVLDQLRVAIMLPREIGLDDLVDAHLRLRELLAAAGPGSRR